MGSLTCRRLSCESFLSLSGAFSARPTVGLRMVAVCANNLNSDASNWLHQLQSISKNLMWQGISQQDQLLSLVTNARKFCSTAAEEESELLFTNVNVEVRGSDEAVLDSYCQFVSRAAAILNFDISGKIVLPTHLQRHTVLKSPHIYKKHMAQFEIRTYKRMLQMRNLTDATASTFLEYIQRNIPEGVSMIVEQTELQPLPDYIREKEALA